MNDLEQRAVREVNSYDLIKSAAVLSMIADHVGTYFFPHLLWLRAIGRFAGPVWFFLPGYSRSRAQPRRIWLATALLAFVTLVTEGGFLPVSALAAIMLTRALIDPLMRRMLRSWTDFWAWGLGLFLLIVPTSYLVEYGTLALLVGVYGYVIRHDAVIATARRARTTRLASFSLLLASGLAVLPFYFHFNVMQFLAIAVVWSLMLVWLARFRPKDFAFLSHLPIVASLLRFTGQYTLEIYVVHLVVFKIISWQLAGMAPTGWHLWPLYGH